MSTPRWRDEIPNSHLFHPCLLYTSTSWGNRALSDAVTAISPIIFFNSRFQWQVYIVVEQMNWFTGWEIVYTMVDIWGALSSCRSQFHLLASWWSLHTPARRPWNCNCFNKRRTPLGERVYDWLRRIPRGEWLYLGCFKCDTLSKKKLRCQYNSLQGIYKPYPKEFFS